MPHRSLNRGPRSDDIDSSKSRGDAFPGSVGEDSQRKQSTSVGFRRRARRQTMTTTGEHGYSTFTAGISLGWYAELGSVKFRQVRSLPSASVDSLLY